IKQSNKITQTRLKHPKIQGKGPKSSSHLQDARVHYTVPKQQPRTPTSTPKRLKATLRAHLQQTQDKHRNTKNPATEGPSTNPTPQKWRTRSTPNPRARRLVASKPNS